MTEVSAEEHLLSRLEVELERGLEATYDQVANEQLMAYLAAGQHLVETVQMAVEIGGEPMRLYLLHRCGPVLEAMETVIQQLSREMEE